MADEITPDVTPEVTPDVVPEPTVSEGNELDAGGLPSAQAETADTLAKFSINDEFVEKNFKNGKLHGRFDSLEAVLNTLHAVETKYSNVMRDIKSGEPTSTDGDATSTQTAEVNLYEVAQPVIEKFVANGFSYEGLDAEIAEIAEKTGKSPAEIKLAAIEIREQINTAHAVVGGKAEYDAMLGWANGTLTDKEKVEFDKALGTGVSHFAIEGLYNRYKTANTTETPQTPRRIDGDGAGNVGVKPYGSLQEIARDRAYLESPKGRNDTNAKQAHSRRLSLTPDKVIYGR